MRARIVHTQCVPVSCCHHIFVKNSVALRLCVISFARWPRSLYLSLATRLLFVHGHGFGFHSVSFCTLHFIYLCTLIWLHCHSIWIVPYLPRLVGWFFLCPSFSVILHIAWSAGYVPVLDYAEWNIQVRAARSPFIRCRHNINIFEWHRKCDDEHLSLSLWLDAQLSSNSPNS